jgi:hypothetical protein
VHVRPLRQPATPPGKPSPATSVYTSITRERFFLAPHHRPPLAGIKLVRPRPRLPARRRGRSSLTPVRTAAQNRSDEENPHHSPAQPGDRRQGHRVNLPCPLDSRGPYGCGNAHARKRALPRNRRKREKR